jgi:hypothetical protein
LPDDFGFDVGRLPARGLDDFAIVPLEELTSGGDV